MAIGGIADAVGGASADPAVDDIIRRVIARLDPAARQVVLGGLQPDRRVSATPPPPPAGTPAVPVGVLHQVLCRLDAAGRRTVLARKRLYERDLRMAAAIPPSPATATFKRISSMLFLADIAQLLEALDEHQEADRLIRRHLAMYADDELAGLALTVNLLERGLIRLGYQVLHAWRRALWASFGPCPIVEPYWNGRAISGRTILVRADQGLGDMLMALRYTRSLAEQTGARVVVEARLPLVRLARRLSGVAGVCSEVSPLCRPAAAFDTWVLCSGLADRLGAAIGTIPPPPYVVPDPALVAWWRPYIAGGGLRVGLNWHGDPCNEAAASRDVPLRELAPLGRIPGAQLISVQKSTSTVRPDWVPTPGEGQDDPAPPGLNLVRLGPKFADLADCAAAMASCDALISSDTSICHLGGALGLPVWLLLNRECHYLWGRSGDRSPWYPTMRIFRQETEGDWSAPINRVADELARLVAERRAVA